MATRPARIHVDQRKCLRYLIASVSILLLSQFTVNLYFTYAKSSAVTIKRNFDPTSSDTPLGIVGQLLLSSPLPSSSSSSISSSSPLASTSASILTSALPSSTSTSVPSSTKSLQSIKSLSTKPLTTTSKPPDAKSKTVKPAGVLSSTAGTNFTTTEGPSTSWDGRCAELPAGLERRRVVNMMPPSWEDLHQKFDGSGILPGGRWKPKDCVPRSHVAIIIPFRERYEQFRVFLNNMHPLLQKQQLNYGIYIIDQRVGFHFNRAMLMNIGFVEAGKIEDYDCFIFHDVDLIAENELNMYNCPAKPRHMSVLIDKFNYRPQYSYIFGGVTALTKEHMHKVNGYPNLYFGWGGEDDDMSARIRSKGAPGLSRVPGDIGRYKMIKHKREKSNPPNPIRIKLLATTKTRFSTDGLNSMAGKYSVLKVEQLPLYTRIEVDIDEKGILMQKQVEKFRNNSFIQGVLKMNETFITMPSTTTSTTPRPTTTTRSVPQQFLHLIKSVFK